MKSRVLLTVRLGKIATGMCPNVPKFVSFCAALTVPTAAPWQNTLHSHHADVSRSAVSGVGSLGQWRVWTGSAQHRQRDLTDTALHLMSALSPNHLMLRGVRMAATWRKPDAQPARRPPYAMWHSRLIPYLVQDRSDQFCRRICSRRRDAPVFACICGVCSQH